MPLSVFLLSLIDALLSWNSTAGQGRWLGTVSKTS